MFTGIVTGKGKVLSITPNPFGVRLLIDPQGWEYTPTRGDSIANNGVCLTHAPKDTDPPGTLAFDVIRETLDVTNLGDLVEGSTVNLESSVTATSPMAGHFVQGHVDGKGAVCDVHAGDDEWRTTIEVAPELMPYIVPKGSIAIDGISLTIAAVDIANHRFTVALIPTTLELTNLGDRQIGDAVNLESDMIVRSIVHVLSLQQQSDEKGEGVTLNTLRAAGFTQ